MSSRAIELTGKCPYCDYSWELQCSDVRGEMHALRCIDCREIFVVEAAVAIEVSVHAIAGVESDAVMDRLISDKLQAVEQEEPASADTATETSSPPPAPPAPRNVADRVPRKREGGYRRKLNYDDRTRIRMRYQAELEAQRAKGFNRLPRGFVQGLALEFGVSDTTVIAIGRNEDSF